MFFPKDPSMVCPAWPPRMIDFGLAHSIDEFPMTDSCGTLYYAAPEVLRGGMWVSKTTRPMGVSNGGILKSPGVKNMFQY